MQDQQGLTLLELMVVLLIIGLATTGVSLALRDSSGTQIEREAQRLVAKLEAARAQSRTSGQTLVWRPLSDGFVIETLVPPAPTPQSLQQLQRMGQATPNTQKEAWLQANTQATILVPSGAGPQAVVVLGPEPIVSPVQISLRLTTPQNNANPMLRIGTDGLRPFEVLP